MRQDKTEPELRREAKELLWPFGFQGSAYGEMHDAFLEAPEGVRYVIEDVRDSEKHGRVQNPAGAVLALIRRGDHLRHQKRAEEPELKRTGKRWVFGVGHAAGTYLDDPDGTDRPPANYDEVTHPPQRPGQWREAEKEVERQQKRTQELIAEEYRRYDEAHKELPL